MVGTGVDSFEVSAEDSLAGGGADFDLQPTMEPVNVARQKAMHDPSLMRECPRAVLKRGWVMGGSTSGQPPG